MVAAVKRQNTPAILEALALGRMLKQAKADRIKDDFAELLADGLTITQAATTLGLTQQRGSQIFKEIRIALGWQAQ